MAAILGGGVGATISISTSITGSRFKGPVRGKISYVNESGDWVDEDFFESVTVHTDGNSAFEPSFKLGTSSPISIDVYYKWDVRGDTRGNKSNSESVKTNNDKQQPNSAADEVIKQTNDTADDLFLKRPDDLTEEELHELMKKRTQTKNDQPLFNELVEKERQWFSARYGDGAVQFDETGKMIPPVAINPAPKEPKPLTVPGGHTMADAIKIVAGKLDKSPDNKTDTIRGLQTAINRTKNKTDVPLKVDGVFGPKSANAFKKAIASLGPTKMTEASALGQFQHTADKAKKSGDTSNLVKDVATTFDALLPNNKGQQTSNIGLALQTTVNETNKDDSQIPKLKEDGILGPITDDVFGMTVKKKDTKNLTDNFGYYLGFA
ncbi:hypothetical protein RYZ26_09065 [Terasakiella sp. A23]|uniref:hypothetical protein n=1 Tax=Terasakiella sp. FCG-A23 TaxID=3080561 RepID=UPI002955B29F|nr:hypothetical protein [Terasakiella sp. A23]MDV7339742.1 hypothetical protein [Terasakiella sp. A23]